MTLRISHAVVTDAGAGDALGFHKACMSLAASSCSFGIWFFDRPTPPCMAERHVSWKCNRLGGSFNDLTKLAAPRYFLSVLFVLISIASTFPQKAEKKNKPRSDRLLGAHWKSLVNQNSTLVYKE